MKNRGYLLSIRSIVPYLQQYQNLRPFDKSETNETPTINILDLLLFEKRLCFWNRSYHPCLAFLRVGDNNVMDEFIL